MLDDLGKTPVAQEETPLSDMECILSCAAVRGYSLEDKQWCMFSSSQSPVFTYTCQDNSANVPFRYLHY